MKEFKFIPEGWNNEQKQISNINMAKQYIDTKETLQGLVDECDQNGN